MTKWTALFAAAMGAVLAESGSAQTANISTNKWLATLQQQGVAMSDIAGLDASGVPEICSTFNNSTIRSAALKLPQGVRSWEVIPSVVRDNGTDTFRLEVNVNGAATAVQLDLSFNLLSSSGAAQLTLRDDGQGNDRIANDAIYTSEPLRFNTVYPFAVFYYMSDTNSPHGLNHADLGQLRVIETNGITNVFLIQPQVGILGSSIALIKSMPLASNLVATPHLINVRTSGGCIQSVLRSVDYQLPALAKSIYSVLPDDFDFFTCIPTDHFEKVPMNTSANFICGMHCQVKVDYTGTGYVPMDNSATYGSAGRLKSINVLDAVQRGIYCNNVTHELLHQWCAYIDFSLGLNDDGAHYSSHSNIGSLVGGQLWRDHSSGTYVMNCGEGRNGAHRAPPLDLYMMGLAPASAVPVSRVYGSSMPGPLMFCDQTFSNIATTATISDIVAREGPRLPAPGDAQHAFSIGFIAESRDRQLTDVEMTFYEILAAAYTTPVPAQQPDPYVTHNWVSIARFFGDNVTWKTTIDSILRPRDVSVTRDAASNFKFSATGFRGQVYKAQRSIDLTTWEPAGTVQADAISGALVFSDTTAPSRSAMFMRLVWP